VSGPVTGSGRVDGLKAVVTGSGGAMGGAIAVLLAREGADVALNDRLDDRTRTHEAEVAATGRDVLAVTSNVTRREGAEALIRAAEERWGRVDVLVNVVGGIKGPVVNSILDISEEEWEITMGLNLRGCFHCTQLVAPGMIARRFGKIVNIASVGWAGEAMHAHYAAAKAGVVAFTRSVAWQLGEHNVNVNAVAPGGTRRSIDIQMTAPAAAASSPGPSSSVSGVGPLGRTNEPEDIANAVLFLVSEESRNISGQLLTVAGGSNPSL
jgi:NAD(P)-dependent dehydrogenase (short-subunit alcohol dehydrogenase family)